MDKNPRLPAVPVPVKTYRGLVRPAVYFEECDWRDDGAVGIYTVDGRERGDNMIGILIPTAEGFRVALSEPPTNDDLGGGLIFVWGRDPISLRFDVVSTSQRGLELKAGPTI